MWARCMEPRLGIDARILRWRCGCESELMCKLKLESSSLLEHYCKFEA